MSCFKWKNFIVTKCHSRYFTRLCSRRSLVSYLYNDSSGGIASSCKIFADDTSIFSKIKNKSCSNFQLKEELEITSKWAFSVESFTYSWPIRQARKVCFSRKFDNEVYPLLKFNDNDVLLKNSQNILWLVLDIKFNFFDYVNDKINKCNKSIDIMQKVFLTLSRNSLLTIYKTFVRPILEYADVIYDKPFSGALKMN